MVEKLIVIILAFLLSDFTHAQNCPPGNPRVAPDIRYIIHNNFTVTDTVTGLMWKRCSEGQPTNASCGPTGTTFYTWREAMNVASESTFAGFSDWRLPNAKELRSIVETGCFDPSINSTIFPNTPSSGYWTSTTHPGNVLDTFGVGFYSGSLRRVFKIGSGYVRLVRGGDQ